MDFVAIAARLLFEVNYEFMNGSSHFQPCLNLHISKYILLREEVREKKSHLVLPSLARSFSAQDLLWKIPWQGFM